MYQVAFAPALMPALLPFIALNREGMVVLVHPETGRHALDHLVALYAWHGSHHIAHITTTRGMHGW